MTTRDHSDSDPKIIPIARKRGRGQPGLTRRDLLNLGVMALDAAERARAAGDLVLARQYTTLAEKCDDCAMETEEA
jgi:hypothetical protein